MSNMSTPKLQKGQSLKGMSTYKAGILQATAHRIVQKHSDQILNQYGITKMQWLIIGTVYDSGSSGIRLTELTKILDTTMAYVTNTVNLLESKNILTRKDDPKDSRVKFICVSKKFHPKCKKIEKTLRNELRTSIYAKVAPEDFHTYIRVLQQLAEI